MKISKFNVFDNIYFHDYILLIMIVEIPRLSGFCPGVKTAENKIFNELQNHPEDPISVLGMMINNRNYIEYLDGNGIRTVDSIEGITLDSTVVIRTHGIKRSTEKDLSENHKIVDLTCKNVKKVQLIVEEKAKAGALVIITGKKRHPEVIGLESYADNKIVVETGDDLEDFISEPALDGKPIKVLPAEFFITSQTTGSQELFDYTVRRVSENWPETKVSLFNSICPVTDRKEKEALALQMRVDVSFVIGDHLSSNADKLYNTLKKQSEKTYFIQDLDDLKKSAMPLNNYNSALVVSSASTPSFVERDIVDYLEKI